MRYKNVQKIFNSNVIFVVGVLLCFCLCWFAKRDGRNNGVCADREPIQQAEEQLNRARENQQETSRVVGEIADRARNIEQRVDRAEEATERARQSLLELNDENQRAGELVEECQRILSASRKRVQARKEET